MMFTIPEVFVDYPNPISVKIVIIFALLKQFTLGSYYVYMCGRVHCKFVVGKFVPFVTDLFLHFRSFCICGRYVLSTPYYMGYMIWVLSMSGIYHQRLSEPSTNKHRVDKTHIILSSGSDSRTIASGIILFRGLI